MLQGKLRDSPIMAMLCGTTAAGACSGCCSSWRVPSASTPTRSIHRQEGSRDKSIGWQDVGAAVYYTMTRAEITVVVRT